MGAIVGSSLIVQSSISGAATAGWSLPQTDIILLNCTLLCFSIYVEVSLPVFHVEKDKLYLPPGKRFAREKQFDQSRRAKGGLDQTWDKNAKHVPV